jgi:hypothetical protein
MATDNRLPMNGEDSKLVLFYGGQRVPGIDGHVLTWKLTEVATTFRDKLINRRRHRTDKKVDGYDLTADVLVPDLALQLFLKGIDDTRDAAEPLSELAVGLIFRTRLGEVQGLSLDRSVAMFDLESPGQSDRLKGSLKLSCEDLSAISGLII